MRIMQTKSHVQKAGANLTLGPLKCWGEGSTRYDTSVTFKMTSSYLHLKPWKSDSLQFMFRTHEKTALLLHQTQSINNTNSVVIAIASETTVKFTIQVHDQTFEEIFVFGKIINDGEWHYVSMEMDKHNIRCIVDQQRIILNIPDNGVPKFDGSLYVGGFKDENVMPGLKGCMRGFSYNYKSEDLSRFAHPSIPGVIAGCRASCQSNPCLHGGECIEHWGTYNCICTNKWAHWGDSCERNINKDEITFDGTKDSYLDLEGFKEDNLLDSTIIFSFRTFESKAILLYIYDALNNFLQLELEKGDRLRLTFNHFRTVVSEYLVYKRYNDGEWKQIVIYQEENRESNFKFNYTKMFVNSPDNFVVVPYSRVHLHDYSSISPYNQETVKPPRSKGRTNSLISEYYRIFVGGLPVNTSVIDNLSGCVRGLKIGNKVFSLQQEAHLRPGVANMCQEGCSPSPCEHKGICLERWGRNKFKCDCHKTNFAGDRCQIEASGEFTGSAVLEYNFELKRKAKRTTSEMLNLSFQTQILPTGKQVVLAVVMSSKHKDQDLLLFALTSIGVAVKHYQQHILHSLLIEGNFADGRSHRLQYWRSNGEMLLTLDDVSKAKTPNSQNALDDLDKIMLGGVMIEKLPSYIEKKQEFVNFTGCLSEVIFTPVTDEPYTFNPLKDLRSFTNDSIVVHGDEIKGCTIEGDKDIITTTENTYTTTTEINADRTMPPWNPGPAETIYLNPPTTTTTETPVVTTTTLVPTIPTLPKVNTTTLSTSATQRLNVTKTAIGHSNIGGTATELEIMVALGIIVGLMLIAVIIALVLCKKRKREKYVIEKKVPPDDLELKIPLNHTSSPPPSHRPYDHIARLDEFSMVSVTLGPKRRKENGIVPGSEPLLNGNDLSPGEYPVQSTFYNKKKNRPASSISEVLEEMERQKREKEIGENPEEEEEENKQKQDELEWDPMTDRIPLTSKPEDVDSEGDPLHVLEQQTDTLDANGDSGYEAESRKDGEEDNIDNTPPTPEKMYMYDISGQNWSSTPNRKLVDYEESIT